MTNLKTANDSSAFSGVLDEIEGWATRTPDAPALLEPGREAASYRSLWRQIEAIGLSLAQGGVERDTAVAVVSANYAELLAAQFGVSRYCACAPLNPALTRSEMETCLTMLRPSVLLADPSAQAVWEAAERVGLATFEMRSAAGPAGTCAIRRRSWGERSREVRNYSGVRFIFQTSGTTAGAKLVPLTDKNCAVRGFRYRDRAGLTTRDCALLMTPPFLHQGWVASLAQLLAGGSVVQAGGFAPEHLARWLEEYRPTWYATSPTVHRAIASLFDGGERKAPSSLRFVRSSGAPLSTELLAKIEQNMGVPVLEGYGLTETGSIAGTREGSPRKPGSAGTSTGTEITIRDDSGKVVSPGELGEITVRGAAVMEGYCGDAGTARGGFRAGWFHTGDLGILDVDGYLFVKGRIHDRINRGGEKVMPQEVEEALGAHPAVAEVAAFSVPHATLGEEVACAVVVENGASASEAELRDFAAQRLARFKIPRRVFLVAEIPRNESQKPKRGELRETVLAGEARAAKQVDAQLPSAVEKRIHAIWKRVLNIGENALVTNESDLDTDEIRLDDDFFELGGDSLQAAILLAKIDAEWGGDRAVLNAAAFFRTPTIATLAEIAGRGDGHRTRDRRVIALQPDGSRTPLFFIPASDEDPFSMRRLADHLGTDQPFFVLNTSGSGRERSADSVEAAAKRSQDALRQARPKGLYILGGHCYGGIVAFETAQRLIADGGRVALVALVDVPTPGYPKVLREWRKYATTVAGRKLDLLREGPEHLKHLVYLTRRKTIAKLAHWKKRDAIARAAHSIVAASGAAGKPCAYEPKNIAVPVVQFAAMDVEVRGEILEDARWGWRDFAGAGFSIRKVPGGHDSILMEPHAKLLAAELEDVLRQIDTGPLS